jgi:outer membrane lipoprotein carrier protein
MNSPSRIRQCVGVSLLWLVAKAYGLPSVHAVARQVDEHYNQLRSLQAEFTEIYQGAGAQRQESGTLWLKKPGKMRWEYRSPQEKLFLSDGKLTWLYLPSERQARKSPLKDLADLRSPLAFLLGKTKLEKELTSLSFAPDADPSKPENVMVRGVPRGLEDRVEQVLLEITPDHRIARMVIHATDDSITEYRFNNQKENIEVPDRQFRFTVPAGTEVIEGTSGEQ